MSRQVISFMFLLFVNVLFSQNRINCDILESFETTRLFYDVDEIPRKVNRLYWKKFSETGWKKLDLPRRDKLRIANPSEEWNRTDLGDKNAQLIYGGKKGDQGFVFLKTKGILISCLIYDLQCGIVEVIASDLMTSELPVTSALNKLKMEISEHIDCSQ